MTIEPELERYYAAAPAGVLMWECVSFSHPAFIKTHHLTTNPEQFTITVKDGTEITFEPGPIKTNQPNQDGEGRHDMAVGIAVTPEVIKEVNRAAGQANDPISLTYRQFLQEGGVITQYGNTIELELNGLEVDVSNNSISGIATLPDLVRRPFPTEVYRIEKYPGLDRK